MAKNWYQEGMKAGKTEDWMNLEETLAEDREQHPRLTADAVSLVQVSIDGWEETDHFSILYGQPMMDDAQDELAANDEINGIDGEVIEKWQENKDSFWEGYINGRKAIGRDVYAAAKKLTRKRVVKTTKRGRKKSGSPSGFSGMR